jgi:protein-S-isoprenylcysteine O-methyltransferase Ste14
VLFYGTSDEQQLLRIKAQTAKLQAELWSAVRTPAVAEPQPIAALVVAGMNNVLDSQGYTQAAWWNQIPIAAWMLMAVIAVFSNTMVGFSGRRHKTGVILLLVLPLVVAIAFLLIADIDCPGGGFDQSDPA